MFNKLLNLFRCKPKSNSIYLPLEYIERVNWYNPKCKISKHFTVHEATYLPRDYLYHYPSPEEKKEIVYLALIMDQLREIYGPIIVHSWIRPTYYNKLVKGSMHSAHLTGQGIDFHFKEYEGVEGCNKARKLLVDKLEKYNIRMEDKPDSTWLHIDTKPVLHKRFFKP